MNHAKTRAHPSIRTLHSEPDFECPLCEQMRRAEQAEAKLALLETRNADLDRAEQLAQRYREALERIEQDLYVLDKTAGAYRMPWEIARQALSPPPQRTDDERSNS